eukprot:scaffold27214_cov63-Phaeocystis_antarctica.AAC.3
MVRQAPAPAPRLGCLLPREYGLILLRVNAALARAAFADDPRFEANPRAALHRAECERGAGDARSLELAGRLTWREGTNTSSISTMTVSTLKDTPHIRRAPHKRVHLGVIGTGHHLSERLADARALWHAVPAEADANKDVRAHQPHERLFVAREAEHARPLGLDSNLAEARESLAQEAAQVRTHISVERGVVGGAHGGAGLERTRAPEAQPAVRAADHVQLSRANGGRHRCCHDHLVAARVEVVGQLGQQLCGPAVGTDHHGARTHHAPVGRHERGPAGLWVRMAEHPHGSVQGRSRGTQQRRRHFGRVELPGAVVQRGLGECVGLKPRRACRRIQHRRLPPVLIFAVARLGVAGRIMVLDSLLGRAALKRDRTIVGQVALDALGFDERQQLLDCSALKVGLRIRPQVTPVPAGGAASEAARVDDDAAASVQALEPEGSRTAGQAGTDDDDIRRRG